MTLNQLEAILTLAGLGFLGFGIEQTAAAEWGYDLNRAVADVAAGNWWTAVPRIGDRPVCSGHHAGRGVHERSQRSAPAHAQALEEAGACQWQARTGGGAQRIDVEQPSHGFDGAPYTKEEFEAELAQPRRLKIVNLGVDFATDHGDVRAVDGVSLYLDPGEILALVGESDRVNQ